MTVQVSDTLRWIGNDYSILGFSNGRLFDPRERGYPTVPLSTNCWRGHVCIYSLQGAPLTLHEMRIHYRPPSESPVDAQPPPLNGVHARRYRYALERESDGWVFDNIGLPMTYDGGLLLGGQFISSLRAHSHPHLTWAWGAVHELIFERGVLITANDLGARVAGFRDQWRADDGKNRSPDPGALAAWSADTFQKNYPPPKY